LPLRTPTGIAADLSSGAATSVVETGLAGVTAHPATAVVRTTLTVRAACCAGIITALPVLAGVARGTTHTGAGCGIAVLTLAAITGSRQTNRAADVGRRAAGSVETALARGAADAIADLAGGTARPIQTALGGIAANAVAAVVRATVSARTAVVPCRNARTAHSVMANLGCGAAVCARVARTIAAAVPDAADRRRGGTAALVAKPFVVGSIIAAFACRRRIGAKHLLTPTRTVRISTENAANAAQTEKATDGGGDNGSQRMPP
jgi:hypothetical protein